MALEIESFDSGSNYRFGDKLQVNRPASSLFDLTHNITTTIDNAGVLQCLDWIKTVPTDNMQVSADGLLRVLAQKIPLYSRQRLYLYCFNVRKWDVWNNAHVFVTKGYSGTDEHSEPTFNDANLAPDTDGLGIQPGSLGDMLGFPQGMTRSQLIGSNSTCLCAYALLRIHRDYFKNKHFWKNDRVILPDDDSTFRCNDYGLLISAVNENKNFVFDMFHGPRSSNYHKDITYVSSTSTYIFGVPYHEYPKDYFTSALDAPQHGDPLSLVYSNTGNIDFSNVFSNDPDGSYTSLAFGQRDTGSTSDVTPIGVLSGSSPVNSTRFSNFISQMNKAQLSNLNLKIYLEDLRRLSINETILEQLAKTDGSYAEFTLNQFGRKASSSQDFRPTLVGSTYQNIVFTEVLQTTPTTQTDPSTGVTTGSPLGSYAGHGISGINNNFMGNFQSDDFGMLFFLVTIMPDVYYFQGLDRKFTDITQDTLLLPDRAKLGMQPILNQELYYQGNNGTDVGEDLYLWAYQDAYDEYRYCRNKISGLIADSSNNSFFPYTQARKFNSLPNWSKEFALADNVRKDYLAGENNEVAYHGQFRWNITAVRPIPYRAIPASII